MLTIQESSLQDKLPTLCISNSIIDVHISLEFGPRILFCGFHGGPNHFFLRQQDLLQFHQAQDTFHFFGGHRFWVAPEHPIATYKPDNRPISWHQDRTRVIIDQEVDYHGLHFSKELILSMHPDSPQVVLTHRLTNLAPEPVQFAPWALSQMAPGGLAVMPLPPRGSHIGNLLPTSSLVLWPYTDLSDPRWLWGYEYLRVQQNSAFSKPLKFGLAGDQGWLAYFSHGQMFLKESVVQPDREYPDRGTPIQIFLDGDFLELETMGPLEWAQPGQTLVHTETWTLTDQSPVPQDDAQIKDLVPVRT